jgi:putative peptidoglycan lipid II flippase
MRHIARSSLIIAVFFALDKGLGLVRQVLIARQFGLTYQIDVFNAANNIPDLLSALISGGALGVALIPILSDYLTNRGRPEAARLFARIVNLAFIVTATLSVLIAVFADPLVRYVIVPGFSPEQQTLTIELMRLDLIAILIFSISGLCMAGLQANQHFLLPAMAPGLYNIGQIIGVAMFAASTPLRIGPLSLPAFGLGVHGLVYGVILGALLHLAIQLPGLWRFGFRWTPSLGLRDEGVRRVLWLMGPRLATMFFLQLFFIIRDNQASRLGEGMVTALNYGWFIMQVPETLIGTAAAIALLPTLAEEFAAGSEAGYKATLNGAVRTLLALTLPVTAILWAGLRPLVQGVFRFDAAATDLVVLASRAYLLGLAGHSLLEIAARSFYARQDARTPLIAAAINAGAYVVLALALTPALGISGIALATTLAFTGEALLLLYLLERRSPGVADLGGTLWRALLGAAVGAAVTAGLTYFLPGPLLVRGLAANLAGVAVALPFIWPEVRLFIRL